MTWIIIMLAAAMMAGFVQGVTGFGSGIVMMVFLPYLLPINQSAGVSTLTMVVANVMIVWYYRKYFKWQKIVKPFLIYILMAIVRSEEHTSELQSRFDFVCRLLLETKK